jgi:AcrR family transcriptional regulator
MEKKLSLTREDWLLAGRKALEDGGVEAVRVEVLAAHLGVSKGSFYWHFENRRALLEALLEQWETSTDWLIEQCGTEKAPRKRFLKLFQLVRDLLDQGERSPDPAIFRWSQQDKTVAKRVARVEAKRLEFLRKLFSDTGFQPGEAMRRAEVSYLIFSGYLERTNRQVAVTSNLDDLTDFMVNKFFRR